jgi:hypothetical protein
MKGHGRYHRLSGGDPICRVLGPYGRPWSYAPFEEQKAELEVKQDAEGPPLNFRGKGNGSISSLSLLGTSSTGTLPPVPLPDGKDSFSFSFSFSPTGTVLACTISAALFFAAGLRDAGSRSHTTMVPSAKPQHSCSGLCGFHEAAVMLTVSSPLIRYGSHRGTALDLGGGYYDSNSLYHTPIICKMFRIKI